MKTNLPEGTTTKTYGGDATTWPPGVYESVRTAHTFRVWVPPRETGLFPVFVRAPEQRVGFGRISGELSYHYRRLPGFNGDIAEINFAQETA